MNFKLRFSHQVVTFCDGYTSNSFRPSFTFVVSVRFASVCVFVSSFAHFLTLYSLLDFQMTDSYSGSANGDIASSMNGMANGSSSHVVLPPLVRKKLMGYVGFANLPNQVHRKSVRKGFQFTAMVVGASTAFFQTWVVFEANSFCTTSALRRVGSWEIDAH